MELVVITGLSGAGRETAVHALEDLGWYAVDNLPPALLPGLTTYLNGDGIEKLAVVLDVRSRGDLEQIPHLFKEMSPLVGAPHLVYVEATDEQIVRRQESNRRPVPLQGEGSMLDGIGAERRMLSTIRMSADMVIDTTQLTVHQLMNRMVAAFGHDQPGLVVTLLSFGYKYGLPIDADLVFDLRFLANPYWVPELRSLTGLDAPVADYVLAEPAASTFLDEVTALFTTMVTGYEREGKHQVLAALGCTGGRHRSVALAEAWAAKLRGLGHTISVIHRDLERP